MLNIILLFRAVHPAKYLVNNIENNICPGGVWISLFRTKVWELRVGFHLLKILSENKINIAFGPVVDLKMINIFCGRIPLHPC